MLATAQLKEKLAKISQEEEEKENSMLLTEEEAVHFKNEIDKQMAETKIVDIGKAMRNARYLTKLDRAFADDEGITFTFEELENFINEIRTV